MRCLCLSLCLIFAGCSTVYRGRQPDPVVTNRALARSSIIVAPPPAVSVVDQELVEWDDDEQVASFNLYYSFTTPTGYDHVITGLTDPSCVVSNMVPGITYYFAATAVDTNGEESALSSQYAFVMPITLEMGFSLDSSVTNVSVQMSNNLLTWQPANARPRTNGLWRVDVDPNIPVEFFRGVGQL